LGIYFVLLFWLSLRTPRQSEYALVEIISEEINVEEGVVGRR